MSHKICRFKALQNWGEYKKQLQSGCRPSQHSLPLPLDKSLSEKWELGRGGAFACALRWPVPYSPHWGSTFAKATVGQVRGTVRLAHSQNPSPPSISDFSDRLSAD
jgi:hypothetical protein